MSDTYTLEKQLWTDSDYEQMSWHDCPIHAISFDKEHKLVLDIDYIFKWVHPRKGGHYFKFWMAPCTLVFENVYKFSMETDHTDLIIDTVDRENPRTPKNAAYIGRNVEYDWIIETTVGEIVFTSVGYKQYIRKPPVLVRQQELDMASRGGISFATSLSD